ARLLLRHLGGHRHAVGGGGQGRQGRRGVRRLHDERIDALERFTMEESSMKRIMTIAITGTLLTTSFLSAQAPPPPPSGDAAKKTLAATMNVYVFPTTGQDATQQPKEEAECYNWSAQNTGTDPFALAKQAQAQAQQTEQQKQQAQKAGGGAGMAGAVKGAAAGA